MGPSGALISTKTDDGRSWHTHPLPSCYGCWLKNTGPAEEGQVGANNKAVLWIVYLGCPHPSGYIQSGRALGRRWGQQRGVGSNRVAKREVLPLGGI